MGHPAFIGYNQGASLKTSRLEAFSDGVIAVIITIMVLELKVPRVGTPEALLAVAPSLLIYGLSFAEVAIFWVNHHHLMEKARGASAALLWSNNLLLFWMSLIPFVTGYLGEYCHVPLALALYGSVFVFTSAAYLLFQVVLSRQDPHDAARQLEFKRLNHKAMFAMACYVASVVLAFVSVYASYAIFVMIPLLYFWPERKGRRED
jgi:uncharacterized membrane protein